MLPIVPEKIIQSRLWCSFNWIPWILDKPMAGSLILRTLKEQEMVTFISTPAKEWPWKCLKFHRYLAGKKPKKSCCGLILYFLNIWQVHMRVFWDISCPLHCLLCLSADFKFTSWDENRDKRHLWQLTLWPYSRNPPLGRKWHLILPAGTKLTAVS